MRIIDEIIGKLCITMVYMQSMKLTKITIGHGVALTSTVACPLFARVINRAKIPIQGLGKEEGG